jgi:hypothetical protein
MTRAIWMHPWDLEDRDPEAVLDHLAAHGIAEAYLAVRYHGGRMYLPTHPTRRVVDHSPGGCYLEPYGSLIERFLKASSARQFPLHAWAVLAHREGPERHCPVSAWGDVYRHAVCPSQPEVQELFLADCQRIDRFHDWASIQLEALGFMGLPPVKTGTTLDEFPLSICFCAACLYGYGAHGDIIREVARRGEQHSSLSTMLLWRRSVQYGLLQQLAAAVKAPLDLRTSASTRYTGGKSTLTFEEAAGLAKACTVTFFGSSLESMEREIDRLASLPRPMPVHAGMVFHGPDCLSEDEFRERQRLLSKPMFQKQIYYCAALATEEHWRWLRG